MVSRTEQATILKIHDYDSENAKDPLERPLAQTIKKTESKHAVGHRTQLARRNAYNLAELRPVVDSAIKQHNKSISE
jgi:hypothetical protein